MSQYIAVESISIFTAGELLAIANGSTGQSYQGARFTDFNLGHITVWMNGTEITSWSDTANHLPGGVLDGHIAVQVHMGNRWIEGGKHRFRNIAIREL